MNEEFNTQIATTIEQSKRLLELGLNPETSDMHYVRKTIDAMGKHIDDDFKEPRYGNVNSKYAKYVVMNFSNYETLPAWSLHRLIAMLPDRNRAGKPIRLVLLKACLCDYCDFKDCSYIYNEVISLIEWMIENGNFNKEYLKEE